MSASQWLIASAVLTACLWLPHVLDRFLKLGIVRTFGNPGPEDHAQLAAWAQRSRDAHHNATANLAIFAPLALLAMRAPPEALGLVTTTCATYFFARVVHFAAYAAGIPFVRTVAFLVGWGAQLTLGFTCWSAS